MQQEGYLTDMVKWIEVNTYEEMSRMAAEIFSKQLKENPKSVLGLATGGTPIGLYEQLVEEVKQGGITFKDVTTFNLDEYVGLAQESPASYWTYMHETLFNHVDINEDNVHLPNGVAHNLEEECANYDKHIAAAGGIDLQLLGIGVNGHIGFNEPGTSFDSLTHVVELTESTRTENAIYFEEGAEMPTHAVTMGIQSIMNAKEIVLLAFGERKLEAMEQLKTGVLTEDFPASQLTTHPNITIIYGGTK